MREFSWATVPLRSKTNTDKTLSLYVPGGQKSWQGKCPTAYLRHNICLKQQNNYHKKTLNIDDNKCRPVCRICVNDIRSCILSGWVEWYPGPL